MGLKAAVLGASGYSGGEILRLLAGHPSVEVVACSAGARAGRMLADVQPHLPAPRMPLVSLDDALRSDADVWFSCLPSGELGARAGRVEGGVMIDLSDDHRADDDWVYGLTEFARDVLPGARFIANPGCYPTAALMALLPFARAGAIEAPVVIDAISGVSGAGRKPEDRLLFATIAGGVAAYGATEHRHVPEMERGLATLGKLDATISFTPHLAPMSRGLAVTARARTMGLATEDDAMAILEAAYAPEPFIDVIGDWPATKAVAGSNHAHVTARVDVRNGWLIAAAAIDNLGKGAAGQAIQNANVALGIEETTGLGGVGVWP